ncbi:hypothetical protein Lyticum_00388 [Lyticum sinuosum]|uniref:Uncharacterized protein n=1 Tax=Lyticum sinuosum TaxID=1332059 RepID=A0AAE5AH66_9RICK|nr:hypothetical protein [Lyticum sinuosum]
MFNYFILKNKYIKAKNHFEMNEITHKNKIKKINFLFTV